jgi:hypothetical protein
MAQFGGAVARGISFFLFFLTVCARSEVLDRSVRGRSTRAFERIGDLGLVVRFRRSKVIAGWYELSARAGEGLDGSGRVR